LLTLAFAQASWIVFAVIPLLAFGGIGEPALQSLQTNAVDRDRQGKLQGVIASFVSLAAIFGPLVFSWIYALSRPGWNGLVWIVGVAIYALTVPIVLAVPKGAGRAS
jgi:MFS transporter, DHA1 family, tetracycline resistance protein